MFAATRALAEEFANAGLTGVTQRAIKISRNEMFEELFPGRHLPAFIELVVTGRAGCDDFGIDDMNDLVMSEAAVAIFRSTHPSNADITPIAK